ncbi:DNA-directed RNA polymerase II subunit RPB4 isoform X1 [Heterocephalus glaber]|uniref:DNA-directed RNA polymerase II subunit RPB4 isoform X1 n=1 Tax=Heterocephalus glaber TaxID=10181 RepID=A0AAX6TL32_HETGA|nr:DNA-directed RNA polymerase II subunit RPB4 isoform X1 [Heterocephalus glaber]
MAAGGSDPRAGDVEEDASQLIFPKVYCSRKSCISLSWPVWPTFAQRLLRSPRLLSQAWRDGLKTRSCSRFLMTSRRSVVFSINLQTSLSCLEGTTFPRAGFALLRRKLGFLWRGQCILCWCSVLLRCDRAHVTES